MVSMAEVPPRSIPHPALRRLGERIRELRAAKNWTQEDLAGECGFDRSYVSGLEVGRRNPTYLKLLRLARSLGLPLLTLMSRSWYFGPVRTWWNAQADPQIGTRAIVRPPRATLDPPRARLRPALLT